MISSREKKKVSLRTRLIGSLAPPDCNFFSIQPTFSQIGILGFVSVLMPYLISNIKNLKWWI